ncbi:MAG TPA: hypothetical protein VF789_13375 [Thermoanaerobaculia bacterium]
MADGDRKELHPSPADLDRFLMGELSPRQAAPVLTHLIRGCDACQRRMQPLASTMFSAGRTEPSPAEEAGFEYDFPLFKAFATARRYAGAKTRDAARVQEALPTLREVIPPYVSLEERARQEWDLCETLIERSRALRHSDPERMILTATLAANLAERLDHSSFDARALADLQARVWAELGNARRIADDLPGAEAGLARAFELAGHGTGAPLLLAQIMDLTASLYTDQRRFQEAGLLQEAVYAIYNKTGDKHSAGRALISRGLSKGYAFDVEEAVQLFSQGLGMIEANREPKLVMVALHNLIWCLVECGRAEQADQLFAYSRDLFASYVERLDAIKANWLEGRIAAGVGDDQRAEERFREARASFEQAKLFYEVALVSLDMTALWLRQGRTAEIMRLIDETIAIFRARKIRREAIGTLLVLRKALHKDQATEALIRAMSAELQRLGGAWAHQSRVST